MNGMVLRSVAVFLMTGLVFWGPAIPLVFAQLEITPEIREACQQFEPGIREIALTEIVPEIEANPEGQEARTVEASAATIHEANQTVADLQVPDQATLEATLIQKSAGVDPGTAKTLAADAQKTLTEMKAAFSAGDPIKADALAKAFQAECQARGVDPSAFGAGKEAGGMTSDRLLGGRDVMETALKAHFETAMGEAFRGGTEGAAPAQMREMMEKMMATGINPGEVMHGGAGEMGTPPKEVLDAMSTTERSMFEAWKSGDTATLETAYRESAMKAGMEAGMSHEAMQREMAQMDVYREMEARMTPDQREVMMREMDPRAESGGLVEAIFVQQGGGGGGGTTRTLTATHDHLPAGVPDGVIDEYHYSDGTASPVPLT